MSISKNLADRHKHASFPETSFTAARIQKIVSKKLQRLPAVYAGQRKAHNMLHLKNLLARIGVLDFDDSVAEHYGQLQAEQKAKGRLIPSSDAQIAATARIYDLVLLSADHYHYMCQVDNLLVENWL